MEQQEGVAVQVVSQYREADADEKIAAMLREHGVDARAGAFAGGGPGIEGVEFILLAMGGTWAGRWIQLFAEQAYDAWFRDFLDATLFRQRPAAIENTIIQFNPPTANVPIAQFGPADREDMDAGAKLLPEVWSQLENRKEDFGGQSVRSLSYKTSIWRAHTPRAVFAYRPGTQRFEQLPRDDR